MLHSNQSIIRTQYTFTYINIKYHDQIISSNIQQLQAKRSARTARLRELHIFIQMVLFEFEMPSNFLAIKQLFFTSAHHKYKETIYQTYYSYCNLRQFYCSSRILDEVPRPHALLLHHFLLSLRRCFLSPSYTSRMLRIRLEIKSILMHRMYSFI